ncbi:hypothetical protein HETIRDRAFT_414505 [Heterobasidion irregulare TC 32-1]|uniref:Uncharacterized protein n=1 Tax=Heterobasidion irregulare (strain TC 32-1) TaxID=747525 RepID=W4KM01_HETIT|nr:uncharacterized protein HETIRDRAFT_414505 [Heterobasidion irregulare TC 32-1]ETW86395.1 hypothetical protein HETIRDRAFT_414505 [Heterobasidion irregulare TC 32-1]
MNSDSRASPKRAPAPHWAISMRGLERLDSALSRLVPSLASIGSDSYRSAHRTPVRRIQFGDQDTPSPG